MNRVAAYAVGLLGVGLVLSGGCDSPKDEKPGIPTPTTPQPRVVTMSCCEEHPAATQPVVVEKGAPEVTPSQTVAAKENVGANQSVVK